MTSTDDRQLLSRRAVEIGTALVLFGLGGLVAFGSLEFAVGWDESGPQPGYFPFRLGLIVMASSLGILAQAVLAHRRRTQRFATVEQGRRVALFFVPIAVFVLLCSVLGIYVSIVLYLLFTTIVQAKYRLWQAFAIAFGTAAAFFVLFELVFQQPLLKGPLEAWLHLY